MVRMWAWLAVALLVAVAQVAWGQQSRPGAQAAGPCVSTGSPQDEAQCELAIVKADRAALQERLDKALAAANIKISELLAGQVAVEKRNADMALWFKEYFGR